MSPLIKTPCTIVSPNLVCFAKSPFKRKGFWKGNCIPPCDGPAEFSPVSSSEVHLLKVLPPSSAGSGRWSSEAHPTKDGSWEHLCHPQTPSTRGLSLLQSSNIMLAPKSIFESRGMYLKLKTFQSNTCYLLFQHNARRKGEGCALKKHVPCLCRMLTGWTGFTVWHDHATYSNGGWQSLRLVS